MKEQVIEPRYMRPQTVAKMYDVSVELVYKALRSGELSARKMTPRIWLISPVDAEHWVETKFAAMEQTA